MSKVINSTYDWARHNHPLALQMLRMSGRMTKEQLDKMGPSAYVFLDALRDTVSNVTRSEKELEDKYSNYTIYEVLQAAEKKNKINELDMMTVAGNLTKELMDVSPVVREMVETAMTTNFHGMPFAETMLTMMKHLGNDIHISDLKDPFILAQIIANVTYDVYPFVELELNTTLPKLKDQFNSNIYNLTHNERIDKFKEFTQLARNITNANAESFKRYLIHYFERKFNNWLNVLILIDQE